MKLLIATTNVNKVREIRPLLAGLPLDLVTLGDLPPISEPEESAATFWENARLKALAYAAATDLVVVAEDSGLEVRALDGRPGVHSARYLGPDVPYPVRFESILRQLHPDPSHTRDARFVTCLVAARGSEILFETTAWIDGEIADAPRGGHGFGYDPLFFYPPLGKTTAELPLVEKSAVSHRARAFRDFARFMRTAQR